MKKSAPMSKLNPNRIEAILDQLKCDRSGLVTVVVQDVANGEVLVVAHANREALRRTLETGQVHFWSRSRRKLWLKGEESGHFQKVLEVRVDCDGDVLLLKVRQAGGAACHTGHRSCFHRLRTSRGGVREDGRKIFDPKKVYKKK